MIPINPYPTRTIPILFDLNAAMRVVTTEKPAAIVSRTASTPAERRNTMHNKQDARESIGSNQKNGRGNKADIII